ncbi:MAG: DUF1207 domain-containing protein [Pirellulales bacterium]
MPTFLSLHRQRYYAPVWLLAFGLVLNAGAPPAAGVPIPAPQDATTDLAAPLDSGAPGDVTMSTDFAAPNGDVRPNGENPATLPEGEVRPNDEDPAKLPEGVIRLDQPLGEPLSDPAGYTWQWTPSGLIYHSYMAGEHEPRMSLFTFSDLDNGFLWDATLGGRAGLVRYGTTDPVNPIGYQLDFYGAANARLDAKEEQDLVATDYVFGFPITWGDAQWQWKFGYAHLSSHLGDEYAIKNPGSLANRINYVRDSVVFGTSYYVAPSWRLYGETGWAFNASGGAEPWDAQFGTEYSNPLPQSRWTPFVAVNGRVREELNFGGDVTIQAGILQRGLLDQTLRLGAQYYNGKSNQFQFFNRTEQQVGIGVWYDF